MLCKYWRMSDKEIYQPMVPRAERKLPVRGVNCNIYEWGNPDAPLLMYLHGWGDTGSTFQFVVDELTAEWRVVAPDWRGFGRSSCECTSYWFPDYLADLHELLEIYSPADPVRLIGHSMGANVASLYAGTIPERVRALVNVEGFGLADSEPADAPQRYRAWIDGAASGTSFSEYADHETLAARIRKRHPAMAQSAAAFVSHEWAKAEPDGVVRLRADPRHKLPNPVLYRRAEAEACWRAISAEMLLVTGSGSVFAREFGDAGSLQLPGCRTVEIEGAGHMIHFEAPRSLASIIEDFLLQPL